MRTRGILLVLVSVSAGCAGGVVILPKLNTPPVADTGGDQDVEVGQRVSLNGMASSDPDEDALTYVWTQLSGPPVELKDANSGVASFVPTEDGIYEFLLTVSDDRGGTDESQVSVFVGEITVSGAPLADAGTDQSVDERVSVTLRGGNSADPDGDRLTYRWRQLAGPEVSMSNPFTAEPSFLAPEVADTTDLEFELRVEDEASNADTDEVFVNVRNLDAAGSPCAGVTCPAGEFCEAGTGECMAPDRCTAVRCGAEESCDPATGECIPLDRCAGITCTAGEYCDADTGECARLDRCEGIDCSPGYACDPATGRCQPHVTGCDIDSDCDDGLYCNGQETCGSTNGICEDSHSPCSTGETCDEAHDECIAAQACSEPAGYGGFHVVRTSIGTNQIALGHKIEVGFDGDVGDTFSSRVVEVLESGPDGMLDTSDDMVVSALVNYQRWGTDDGRITINLAPFTETLTAGRRYRITIQPGCMRALDDFGNAIALDGEFSGSFPSGDNRQGGEFVQEFLGIERRIFATGTGGISALAIRPTDGALFGVGPGGSFGPITSQELPPIAARKGEAPFGSGFTPDGQTLLATSKLTVGYADTAWNLQRINLTTGAETNEVISNGPNPIVRGPLSGLRVVPAGYVGTTVAPGDIVGVGWYGVYVLHLSARPAEVRTLTDNALFAPFHFTASGTLLASSFAGINQSTMIASILPSGSVVPLVHASDLDFVGLYGLAMVSTFPIRDGIVAITNLRGMAVAPLTAGHVGRFDDVFSSAPTDMVLSLDRTRAFVALPSENAIIEYFGFPTN